MELFLAFQDLDFVVQGILLSLSSCLWNVVHNFGLVGKGVVTDVTDLPVPEGRVSSVKYFVSALRASASRDAESDCVVLVISSVN